MQKLSHNDAHETEEVILTKALKKAATYWEINNKQLGEVCGLSEATISRLKNDQYILDYNSKQWQLAVIFLRIFRGLDAYMGGDIENEKIWLKANNRALGGIPIDLMRNVEGLISVVQYIDYMRGH